MVATASCLGSYILLIHPPYMYIYIYFFFFEGVWADTIACTYVCMPIEVVVLFII